MNKPYLLFRNHNSPYWYAQIRLADGSLSNNKSTGKESRTEAEKVVMEWVVKGECPKRVSKKGNSKNTNSLDTLAILNQLKTKPFTDSEITRFFTDIFNSFIIELLFINLFKVFLSTCSNFSIFLCEIPINRYS